MNEVYKALADPTRRDILKTLRKGQRSAGELSELFDLSKSTLSGHFAVLKAADLVKTTRQGTSIIYRLNATVFEEVLESLMTLFNIGEEKTHEETKETLSKKETTHEIT